ncbi:DNA repair protein rad5 [Pseudocercospora fuligena]|uniref:DNA repair protein rad5 n=1 Tax=Pseudocercospora fuligena TaxID=685502 RepID=A0A8H6VEQ1_9PEZI|nr:DNA repair protein rad5 [Pseudocercospora fuligena]
MDGNSPEQSPTGRNSAENDIPMDDFERPSEAPEDFDFMANFEDSAMPEYPQLTPTDHGEAAQSEAGPEVVLPTTEAPDEMQLDGASVTMVADSQTAVSEEATKQEKVTPPAKSNTPPEKPKGLNFGAPMLKGLDAKAKALAQQEKLKDRFRKKQPPAVPQADPERSNRHDSMELDTSVTPTPSTLMPPPATPLFDPIAEEFKRKKERYLRRQAAKLTEIEEDIQFIQDESREAARLRKKEADEASAMGLSDDDEDTETDQRSRLFMSGPTSPSLSNHQGPFSGLYSDDEDEPAPRRRKGKGKRKLVELSDGEDEEESRRSRKSKARKKSKHGKRGDDYTDQDVEDLLKKAQRKSKLGGKKGSRSKKGGPAMANLTSIYGTNVFKDTQQNAEKPDQPTFDKRRKDDALKQLIASVPAENRKIASADKKYLLESTKAFTGQGTCFPSQDGTGNWHLRGLKSTLKHYQVLGAAFMRKREGEAVEPRGGILADEMGLGKTVMMLANVVNGRNTSPTGPRCTLIVASPALCTQWDAEIAKHCLTGKEAKRHGIRNWVQHRAGHRIGTDEERIMQTIQDADICLTTYHEISKSYPKAQVPVELTTADQKDSWWKEYFRTNKGLFHKIKFHRVVLDEAQAIKNHAGHTSLACRAVMATHHWAISGTPIMNRLSEFYPYFKFLREPHTGSFKIFKENFCCPDDPDGTGKLAVFLRKIMIRRTHLDTLFGARLLDLPQPKQHVVWLSFNETERAIYEIVKNRFVQRINTISKQEGNAGLSNHYNHIWTMLLRLRQLCAHILLVQGTICDLLKREDFEKLNSLSQHASHSDDAAGILVHLRNVLQESLDKDTVEAGAAGTGRVISAQETAAINAKDYIDQMNLEGNGAGGKHGLSFNFGKYMNALAESDRFEDIMERSTCCACRQQPEDPHITSCFHIYCLACLHDLQHHAAGRGRDCANCTECGSEYTSVEPCKVGPMEMPQSSVHTPSINFDETPTGKKKRKQEEADWIGLKGEILPSTKTIAVKAQILNWLKENPRVKIIVYTQFMPVVRILGNICQTERWGHVKYYGGMSQDARNHAIETFTNGDANIMLASLRCGGLGLNLTMASRVILIDPWWNSAVEQQAFCRVFRIGQEEETRMTRFVIENSIDAAMMAMKERKEKEIDEVMENPRLKEHLSVEELMEMFGDVRRDENGKPFIFAQEAPGEEENRYREVGDDDDEVGMGNEL